jgi:16S rRNA (cytidine1402-2'-O)-methyltransferase
MAGMWRGKLRSFCLACGLRPEIIVAAPGRIDVVATPIGNLADLSARARDALANADVIAAEDTRHTGNLLRHIGVQRPLVSLHDHNEAQRREELLLQLQQGARVVLVSDAGTPLVSDPGFLLVRAALDAGIEVQAVPGPSAVLVALAVSGLPVDRFCFEGFLPSRPAARRERLRALVREARTMVFFEAPHRIVETLEDMAVAFGDDRGACVARELTKTHESVYRGSIQDLLQISREDANFARGEITLVVAGAVVENAAPDDAFVMRALDLLAQELPPSRAAAVVAQLTGRRKADVYAMTRRHGAENSSASTEEPMTQSPLKLLSSMATRELLAALATRHAAATGQPVIAEAAGGVDVARRVEQGEAVDVVVLAANAIDKLIAAGKLLPGSRVDLVKSGVAMAVRAGAPHARVASEEDVRNAVLAAKTLSYSTGPSGVYLENLFERWGIMDTIRARIVVPPPGVPVGSLVASGAVALGFQQLSELKNLDGIEVLGPLPDAIQTLTVFSGGISANSAAPDAARSLLEFMAAPQVAQLKQQHGMAAAD